MLDNEIILATHLTTKYLAMLTNMSVKVNDISLHEENNKNIL